ncbi:MAG TPA: IPT/TIG domain-containing protein [Acidobacteriaceae bacterium]
MGSKGEGVLSRAPGRILKAGRTARVLAGVAAILLTTFAATAVHAQEPLENAAPTQLDIHGKQVPATLPHMYQFAFRLQSNLEKLAEDQVQAGGTGVAFRTYLQSRLHLTETQFASFKAAAARFDQKEREMKFRLHAMKMADRNAYPGAHALSDSAKPAIHQALAELDAASESEAATLHGLLGPDLADRLDTHVTQLYAGVSSIPGHLVPGVPGGRAAPPKSAQSRVHPLQPSGTVRSNEAGPCYFCGGASEDYGSMTFTPDGTTVVVTIEASISQDQYDNGCWPDVVVNINDNGSPAGGDEEDSYDLTAVATATASVNVGDRYDFSGSYVQSCGYANGCTSTLVTSTGYQTGAPNITNISPTGDYLGSKGTFTLSGTNLAGPPGNTATISSNTSGFSPSISQPADYSASTSDLSASTQPVDYTIASTAPTGAADYTIGSVWGSSTGYFQLSCGSPTISGVQPSTYPAGQTSQVTITGSGFCSGTSTVSISVPAGTVTVQSSSSTSTQLFAQVTPDASDPSETGSLTVSNASAGSGFAPGPGGGSSSSSPYSVNITNNGTGAGSLYTVDPYPFYSNSAVDTNALLASLPADNNYASGLVADGGATLVAVYQTQVAQDVSFTVANGLLLFPYDPNFMNVPVGQTLPAGGTSSMTVSAGGTGWVDNGTGTYSALVLVRAPLPGYAGFLQGASPTLAVAQGVNQETDLISLYPKPVLFIHGLWGSAASLANTAAYVQSNATNYLPGELIPICYSRYLGFDQPYDPYGVGGCEKTSADAIADAIDTETAALSSLHIIAGRFDVVAHSMGGLAARNYSAHAGYYGPANLNQGAFSTLVTIDTPESGSALASWLLNNAGDVNQAPIYTAPGILWSYECGLSSTTTLQQCFGQGLQLPLTGPGAPLAGGAVDSLRPDSPSILNAPPANIPNVNWRAISAYFSDTVIPMPLLRGLLQEFIDAVLYTQPSIPSLSDILSDLPNDVIVTTDSQNAGKPIAGTPFPNLAHTGLPFTIYPTLSGLTGLSTDNVLASNDVNQSVLCLLQSSGSQVCNSGGGSPAVVPAHPQAAAQQAEQGTPATRGAPKARFDASVITLATPDKKITLGEPNQIDLKLASGDITVLHTHQVRFFQGSQDAPVLIEGSVKDTPILSRPDGRNYIVVVPLHLGRTGLDVFGEATDGTIFHQVFLLDVKPPLRPAASLTVSVGGQPGDNAGTIYLHSDRPARTFLVPQVSYPGLGTKVELDASAVQFLVRSRVPGAVVMVEKTTGILRPIAPGHALIETSFGGAKNLTCVVVTDKERFYERTRCEELLAPGEKLSLPSTALQK